jgi:excisionase family DNA binding protein
MADANDTPAASKELTPLKATDVARQLGIGLSSVYRLVAEGKLRCARYGPKTLRFAPGWVEAYLASVSGGGATTEPTPAVAPKIEGAYVEVDW